MPSGQMKKSKYTPEEKIKLFQFIEQYLTANPEHLKSEGVFRVAGNKENLPKLIKKILKKTKIEPTEFSVHDYLDVLKFVLREHPHLKADDPKTKALRNAPDVDSLTSEEKAKLVKEFITALAKSPDAQDQQLAQMLFTFGHLMKKASEYSSENKMHHANLGIILGPNIANLILPENADPATLMTAAPKLNHISKEALASDFFVQPYDVTFPKTPQSGLKKGVSFQKGLETMDPSLFKSAPTQTPLLKRTSSITKLKNLISKPERIKAEGPDTGHKIKKRGA